jgi:hypothetical protein
LAVDGLSVEIDLVVRFGGRFGIVVFYEYRINELLFRNMELTESSHGVLGWREFPVVG